MRRLSSIIAMMLITMVLSAQKSPHGEDFALGCDDCHNPESWKIDFKTLTFNHGNTKFPLEGQHQAVSCRQCHQSLTFKKAGKSCSDCHTDIHYQTVGPDCERCHTPLSWVVNDITGLHQKSRFPLVGAHLAADCYDCHNSNPTNNANIGASASLLTFSILGIQCIDCHVNDYNTAVNPSHKSQNFSTNCTDCHNMNVFSWRGAGINHNFFPLTLGHEGVNCTECHKTPDYSGTSPLCASCHISNYNATTNPNHASLEFSTNCLDCHSTNPGWRPAEYRDHDVKSFPIYSGSHNGEWSSCSDCHPNSSNYAQFTCTNCHEHNQGSMDEEHNGVQGYAYNSPDCLACHPRGDKEGFDHSIKYPLKGAHLAVECVKCHTNGYIGTPNTCSGCHMGNYNQSLNPTHPALTIPTECETCHTTDPGWKPATFPIHDNYWVIQGAHTAVATDCFKCHQGNYPTQPSRTCDICHIANYNQTTNPNHITANFPITCATCHSQTAWSPSTFDHNTVYPLVGAHATIAQNCFVCHQGSYVNTPNTCAGCHTDNYNQTTNPNHISSNFPTTCETCHSQTAWVPSTFNHNTIYPLTGSHATQTCFACHQGSYVNTPNTCAGCHMDNYNQTTNPSHSAAQFPTTCSDCHNTTAWTPANWNHDNQYFPIYSGKHAGEWNTCTDCHTNPANYNVFSCIDCHEHTQSSTNSQHQGVSGYAYNSAACYNCHPKGTGDKLIRNNFRNE